MSLVTYWRTRLTLLSGGAVACVLAATAGAAFGLPAVGSRAGSLLAQPSPVVAIVLTAAVIFISCLLGTLLGGRIRPDAGLFAAAFSLVALSWQSGRMRDVLFTFGPATNPFPYLALELVILAALMGLCQFAILLLVGRGIVAPDDARDGVPPPSSTTGEIVLAFLCTAGATAILAWFLIPTDGKQQAVIGIGLAAFIATAAVHFIISPTTPLWPHWLGVVAAGIAMYGYAYSDPGVLSTGVIDVPPARALPLDFAGAGIVGATGAYWYARHWKRPIPDDEQ